ncbi:MULTISPECIES: hypothetical protein [Streptomyces]|jgi:hypothetical protein|uniref:hypothetical protein n=1 Tax=Streptomyces TaxID=1883 RepID=UPI0033B27DD8
MGIKDQQGQAGQHKGKGKMDQARERAGQRGQQQPQPNRGRQDMEDTEMQDRLDHDYDA